MRSKRRCRPITNGLEMNSPLEQDYDEFKFSRENKVEAADIEENFRKISDKSLISTDLERCEICDQKFQTKKDLQAHIFIHLRKPRVVLKRISNVKTARKETNDKYWLDSEQKGTLKITLKKQTLVCDSLKLKLKKSPLSEAFTVVSNNVDIAEKSCNKFIALAEVHNNDVNSDSEEEKTTEQSYENVIVHQENNYDDDDDDNGDDNYECEPDQNPLESLERPSMDNNEGDSGVGSDSANPLEREDPNVDDLQTDNISNSDQTEVAENEDPEIEESDALEATCRETIENLKKLGELESRSSEILNPRESSADEDEDEENVEEEEPPTNPIEGLKANSEISIVPKSALMPEKSVSVSKEAETEIVPISGGNSNSNSSFSWNKVIESSNKSRDGSHESTSSSMDKEESENAESAGSILQNFLLEQQQRNQAESNNTPSLETEYVSLEKLAETVNTCRVCNEKFKDIAHLDAHKSKAGHYQCSVPDCSSLVFTTPMEVAAHKASAHGAPISPSIAGSSSSSRPASTVSPHHLNSPHSQSPRLSQASPHLNTHSPHSPIQTLQQHPARNSPITSPHANSPTFAGGQPTPPQQPHVYPAANLEQLPAPVQQLAQQVQRMPLPQPQMPPGAMAPGPAGAAAAMMPGANYYGQPPGRPPMYRMQAPPHAMHYPPNLHAHVLQQQYAAAAAAANSYQQQLQGMQPQMQPQIPQQMAARARYPAMAPGQRASRLSQPPVQVPPGQAMQRARMKRPMPSQPVQMQQSQQPQQQHQTVPSKQRRMDVLMPDRNEDADCHVIAQQKRNDGLPVIQNVQGNTSVQQSSSRSDSTIHLTDSITLSVRQPGHNPAQVNAMVQSAKKPDASAVANVLAARGITVTPASSKKNADQNSQQSQQQQVQQQPSPQKQPINVSALNLNSAISIIPAATQRKQQQQQQQPEQQGQFAVPQNKQNKQINNEVERPPRPPTVDLTQDTSPLPPVVRRGRPPRMLQSLTCQVCDKRFQSQEILTQHMASHRTTNKLLHKCNLCPAQYPTAAALATHKKTYHKEVDTTLQQNGNIELALPVVDLKSPNTLQRLSNLGIQSYIPLSQLSAQTGGYFALPIVTIDGARNPNTSNLAALGATSILSLGPLKHLTQR